MIFPICRYLKDFGYDCTLFLLDEYEHFLPQADTDIVTTEIIPLGWNETTFGQISKEKISSIFKNFDFFIGTDYSAAYLSKANITLDIYLPAGSDLFHYPFKTFNSFLPQVWEIDKYKCARNQFWGIKQANFLSLDQTNELIEKCLEKINPLGKRIPILPFLYLKNGVYPVLQLPEHMQEYAAQIQQYNFVVIQHCRQAWNYEKSNPHYKANDVLIKGFATFAKGKSDAVLVLLEYGEHVDNSRALIRELNIENQVIWLPKMQRKYLMQFIKMANIGVGELGNSWMSYGAVYEILACGVAFLGYREDKIYQNKHGDLYPMLNAKTKKDVADQLNFGFKNLEILQKIAKEGQSWVHKNAFEPSIERVLEIIKTQIKRRKLPRDYKLILMQPCFFLIKLINFLKTKLASK